MRGERALWRGELLAEELAGLEVAHGLTNLRLSVHHERAVAGHGLTEGATREEVHPELEPPHQAVLLPGHLAVDDPAACGHPLDGACREDPLVAHAVAVFHGAREHVRHGLEAPVRVTREAGEVVSGIVRAEL